MNMLPPVDPEKSKFLNNIARRARELKEDVNDRMAAYDASVQDQIENEKREKAARAQAAKQANRLDSERNKEEYNKFFRS